MREFLVGLLVLILIVVLSGLAILLIPFLVVLGFFLRWLIGIALILFSIWLIGKLTLMMITFLKNKKT